MHLPCVRNAGSPLEGAGFEPSVPEGIKTKSGRLVTFVSSVHKPKRMLGMLVKVACDDSIDSSGRSGKGRGNCRRTKKMSPRIAGQSGFPDQGGKFPDGAI